MSEVPVTLSPVLEISVQADLALWLCDIMVDTALKVVGSRRDEEEEPGSQYPHSRPHPSDLISSH
jgi:hypothetical protein